MSKSYFPSKRLTAIALAAVSISWAVKVRGEQNLRLAYISDSPGSSSAYWIAKEAGLFKKHGLDYSRCL
jgi:ABC-type nitrate/sulfonate/bicarbonate transport system substrate-binding protein